MLKPTCATLTLGCIVDARIRNLSDSSAGGTNPEHAHTMRSAAVLLAVMMTGVAHTRAAPDADAIIRRSTAANRADWAAAPDFEYTEQVRDDEGAKTYAVVMLLGTPYKRLIEVDGHSLAPDKREQEIRNLADERAKRRDESPSDRAKTDR